MRQQASMQASTEARTKASKQARAHARAHARTHARARTDAFAYLVLGNLPSFECVGARSVGMCLVARLRCKRRACGVFGGRVIDFIGTR